MTKNEFLQALDARLDGLTDAERQGILDYYGEIIDDSAEDGMGEEAAVALLGDVGAIARELLENRPAGGEGAADKCVRPARAASQRMKRVRRIPRTWTAVRARGRTRS